MFGVEVTTAGDIISEPNLTHTQGGMAVCRFTLLCRRTWKDKTTQETRETRATFPVICFWELAENVAASLSKGDRVLVTGKVEEREWEDEHRGQHTRLELTANELGPALYFTTCTVIKNPRRGEAVAAPATPAARSSQSRPRHYDDEEPF